MKYCVGMSFPLRIANIHVSYDGVPVLNGIDLELAAGSVTVIAGANGAGKSTLLEVMAGVREPSSGHVDRVGSVALVVQRTAAPDELPITVREVVAMGTWGKPGEDQRGARGSRARLSREDRRNRVIRALDRVALAELAERPFSALSGGQRQRALLAQGIARRASVFLLDEPASGLDFDSRERTQTLLTEEAARGAAVACVTHDEVAILAADRVVRLDGGVRVA